MLGVSSFWKHFHVKGKPLVRHFFETVLHIKGYIHFIRNLKKVMEIGSLHRIEVESEFLSKYINQTVWKLAKKA